jgi:hypothetical protein
MIAQLKQCFKNVYEYHTQMFGPILLFFHVSYDHYDGTNDIPGISIIFINPTVVPWGYVSAGVGLDDAENHTAETTADQVKNLLRQQLGIEHQHLIGAGVDTTNSTLASAQMVKGVGRSAD